LPVAPSKGIATEVTAESGPGSDPPGHSFSAAIKGEAVP
jgi:hypothetical protein